MIVSCAISLLCVAVCGSVLPVSYGGLLPSGVTVNGRVVNDVEWRHEVDGDAVRYQLPRGKRVIASEDTVWTLPEDAMCWYQVGIEAYEMAYSSSRVCDVPQGKVLALPIMFKLSDGCGGFVAMLEKDIAAFGDSFVGTDVPGRMYRRRRVCLE